MSAGSPVERGPTNIYTAPMIEAQHVISALPDGALIVDAAGIVLSSNRHVQDLLQANPDGLPVLNLFRAPAFRELLEKCRKGESPPIIELELKGAGSRLVAIHAARLQGRQEMLVVLRDFTREQAIEKIRADFVANASHEMRTPLSSIMGSIETLQGAAKNDAKARGMFLDTMLTQARRMKRLIDDLLTLSRIELNEHVRPNAKVSLADIAKQAAGNLAALATEASVKIDIEAGEPAVISGDAEELLQVVQNLVENAIKYGGSGGRVLLRCSQRGSEGRLDVCDFGKGIPEIHLPRLTERFYRVSTQESRQRGGTGLGLAIVKHIVLRHRGRLDIQSELGQGSTFTVSIPLYNS